jgi:hypothetical protein
MSILSIRWGRVIIGGIIVEVAVILILIALVATFGPSEPASAQAFAERLGRWVGPIGGALCSFLAAFYVARPLTSGNKTNGVAVGVFLAVLDVVLLVARFRLHQDARSQARAAAEPICQSQNRL